MVVEMKMKIIMKMRILAEMQQGSAIFVFQPSHRADVGLLLADTQVQVETGSGSPTSASSNVNFENDMAQEASLFLHHRDAS
jgi:hypothetical protein